MKPAASAEMPVLFYRGPSMNPLLRENDLLGLERCGHAGVRPGDVVAFADPASGMVVVHRVISSGPGGLTTRGDNNSRPDDPPVQPSRIIGRVTAAWRGSARIGIAGGRRGLFAARVLWLRRTCRVRLASLVRRPWRAIRDAGVRLRLRACAPPRVVTFSSDRGCFTRLIIAGRAVGCFDHRTGVWQEFPGLPLSAVPVATRGSDALPLSSPR